MEAAAVSSSVTKPVDDGSAEVEASATDAASRHMKVAEAAVTGWEKATAQSTALKVQLEQALQEKEVSERKAARLDSALKESIRELRRVRDEQARRIQDVAEEKLELKADVSRLSALVTEQENQLTEMQTEMDAMVVVLEDRALIIQDMEKQVDQLRSRLKEAEKEKTELVTLKQAMFKGTGEDDGATPASPSAGDLRMFEEISLIMMMSEDTNPWESQDAEIEMAMAIENNTNVKQTVEEDVAEVSSYFGSLALVDHVSKGRTQAGENDSQKQIDKTSIVEEKVCKPIKVIGESVEYFKSDAEKEHTQEGEDIPCLACKKLAFSLSVLEKELQETSKQKKRGEEAVALLEGELGKMSGRLTGAENKSVTAAREASLMKQELTLAKEEMNRLSKEVRNLRKADEENDRSNGHHSKSPDEVDAVLPTRGYKQTCEKLEKEQENLRQERSGSDNADELTSALATANHKIAKLSRELAESKQETFDVDKDLAAVEEMVGQLTEGLAERESLRAELAAARKKALDLSTELTEWRTQTFDLQDELASAQLAISSLSKEVDGKDDIQSELAASKERVVELSNELAQWRSETAKLGAELTWAQNRVTELVGAGTEVEDLREQVHEADAKLTELEDMLMSAEADKKNLSQELKLARAAVLRISLQVQGLKSEAASYQAEVKALREGNMDRANELEISRDAEGQKFAKDHCHSTGNNLNLTGVNPSWPLSETESLEEEINAELEAAAQWTIELESRLEEERQSKEQLQAELGRQDADSATLSAMLEAATERESMLESRLVEAEARVGEVRRSLFAMHKEKLTVDMDLALANAARAELGSRLDMANNEVCALVAKLNALVDDSHLDRERREAVKSWLLQEGLDSVGSEGMFNGGRVDSKDFAFSTSSSRHSTEQLLLPSLSYNRSPARSNLSEPMYSPSEKGMAGESRLSRPSPLPPRRPNSESFTPTQGSRRPSSTSKSKVNAYYHTPNSRRSRNRAHPPVTLGDNSADDTGGFLSESMAEEEKVGGKRVTSPLSAVDIEMDDCENIGSNKSSRSWASIRGDRLGVITQRGAISSPASSQETLSPAATPTTVLLTANGSGFSGPSHDSPKGGVPQKQLEFGLSSFSFLGAAPGGKQGVAGFLGRSKRSKAEESRG